MSFIISGMTCVACSTAIENAIRQDFKDKGLVEANVILLTHKLKVVAYMNSRHLISSQAISDSVEAIGFKAELFETSEVLDQPGQPKETEQILDEDEEKNASQAP